MNDNFITIASFNHEWELYVLRNALEAEGIRCFTMNKTMLSVHHSISENMGGIELMVHEDDLEWAEDTLKKLKFNRNGTPSLDVIIDDTRYEKAVGFCPNCDQAKVFKEKFDLKNVFLHLFFFKKQKYICVACRHSWEQW